MQGVSSKKILLVDDEIIPALEVIHSLESYGYVVSHAINGEAAQSAVINDSSIALVLMDIDLGNNEDGILLAGVLLEIKDIPIVFLSSHTSRDFIERSERVTTYGYVVKNSNETALIASIKMAFRLFLAHKMLKESERELMEKESHLRIAQSIAHIGSWRTDLIARSHWWSHETYAIFGWPLGRKVIYDEFMESVHPDDRAPLRKQQIAAEKGESVIDTEYRIIRPSGEIRYLYERCISHRDKNNTVTVLEGIVHDITEKKLQDEKLSATENRWSGIVDCASDCVFLFRRNGSIAYSNSRACEVLGYTREELQTLFIYDIDASATEKTMDSLIDIFNSSNPYPVVHAVYKRKDGLFRPVEASISLIEENGEKRVLAVARDFMYRDTIQSIIHYIAQLSWLEFGEALFTSVVTYIAKQFECSTVFICRNGVSPHSIFFECLYQNGEIIVAKEETIPEKIYHKFCSGKTIVIPHSLTKQFDTGGMLSLSNVQSLISVPLMGPSGEMIGRISVADKKSIENAVLIESVLQIFGMRVSYEIEQSRQSRERASSREAIAMALEEKNTLFSELQHRVKNSLMMISSLISLENMNVTNPEVKKSLESIRSRVNTITYLYSMLYKDSRTKYIRMDQYLHQIINSFNQSYLANNNRVLIHQSLNPLAVDPKGAGPIGLILNELLTNAVKYAFPDNQHGSIWVELSEDDGIIELIVSDDGQGLPVDFSFDNTNGVGTSLVLLLSQQLGGNITYERRDRTFFILRIPSAMG